MIGIKINNGFLDLSETKFECPHCGKDYDDYSEKYLKRCNKNKRGYVSIKCGCGYRFYMTYDYKGNAVSFKNS